jgi:hypothetical protein
MKNGTARNGILSRDENEAWAKDRIGKPEYKYPAKVPIPRLYATGTLNSMANPKKKTRKTISVSIFTPHSIIRIHN